MLVEISLCAELHQKIEVVIFNKDGVELNYVGVIEERLYFYLTDDLEDYFRIFADLTLRDLL